MAETVDKDASSLDPSSTRTRRPIQSGWYQTVTKGSSFVAGSLAIGAFLAGIGTLAFLQRNFVSKEDHESALKKQSSDSERKLSQEVTEKQLAKAHADDLDKRLSELTGTGESLRRDLAAEHETVLHER